jgi:hypothetical protein
MYGELKYWEWERAIVVEKTGSLIENIQRSGSQEAKSGFLKLSNVM